MENRVLKLRPVNNQNLEIIETAEGKLVPIRPICLALGISSEVQIEKLKKHPIFSSTYMFSISVAEDGKNREMFCLPFKYIFGWLFSIDARNVNENSAENIINAQLLCYDILYNNLADKSDFLEEKQKMLNQKLSEFEITQEIFNQNKEKLKLAKTSLQKIQNLTFEEWQLEKNQLTIVYEPVNN